MNCSKLDRAYLLRDELEMCKEIPVDYDAGDLWYPQILAEIRHAYTNYEDLLCELPDCWDLIEQGRCPMQEQFDDEETWQDCSNAAIAHDVLKYAAKDVARQAYDAWAEAQEGKVP